VKRLSEIGGMVYTVGNEQDYHFKVLFLILKSRFDWSENLSFIVRNGRFTFRKNENREGTVVDADDLMQEMTDTTQKIAEDLGK
jgi:arginyl-tRNA synthetase